MHYAGPTIAFYVPSAWWVDPAAAIVISLYILYSWYQISMEQVWKEYMEGGGGSLLIFSERYGPYLWVEGGQLWI